MDYSKDIKMRLQRAHERLDFIDALFHYCGLKEVGVYESAGKQILGHAAEIRILLEELESAFRAMRRAHKASLKNRLPRRRKARQTTPIRKFNAS